MSLPQHQREQIRISVLNMLKAAIEPLAIIKTFNMNRFRAYWHDEEIPALSVYSLSETAEVFNEAPRNLRRRLELAVEIVAHGIEGIDNFLDSVALQVENVVFIDETLNGLVSDCRLTGTEMIQRTEGESPVGAIVLRFDATYFTDAPEQQNLPPYEGADIIIKPSGSLDEDGIEATANVEP